MLSRSLRFDSSEDYADDDDLWTELNTGDYVHVGVTSFYQLVVLCAVIHLWRHRSWPPYCPRQVSIVCLTGLAGIVSYMGIAIASGAIDRHDGDLTAHCGFVSLFDYTGWGMWISIALVRVYRSWKILVKHSVDMWPPWAQILLLTLPWCIPLLAYSIDEALSPFNERRNWCEHYVPIDTFLFVYGCIPMLGAFGLVFQMRKVRKQMNEFRLQVGQLVFLLLTVTVLFPVARMWLDRHHEIRRIWVLYHNVFSSLILFWPPIAEPIYRNLTGDEEYLYAYTKGFSTLPTPAQLRSSFKNQLSLEQLRAEFAAFAELRVARELPDFYTACLDREETTDFFARQAATTAIIDRFIKPGSEQEVNLSGRIREEILSTPFTSYNIFNEAMEVVLGMMESNFSVAFKKSDAYKKFEQDVQREADELSRLQKMRQLPAADHVEREPRGLLKILRRLMPAQPASFSDKSSSVCHYSDDGTPVDGSGPPWHNGSEHVNDKQDDIEACDIGAPSSLEEDDTMWSSGAPGAFDGPSAKVQSDNGQDSSGRP